MKTNKDKQGQTGIKHWCSKTKKYQNKSQGTLNTGIIFYG